MLTRRRFEEIHAHNLSLTSFGLEDLQQYLSWILEENAQNACRYFWNDYGARAKNRFQRDVRLEKSLLAPALERLPWMQRNALIRGCTWWNEDVFSEYFPLLLERHSALDLRPSFEEAPQTQIRALEIAFARGFFAQLCDLLISVDNMDMLRQAFWEHREWDPLYPERLLNLCYGTYQDHELGELIDRLHPYLGAERMLMYLERRTRRGLEYGSALDAHLLPHLNRQTLQRDALYDILRIRLSARNSQFYLDLAEILPDIFSQSWNFRLACDLVRRAVEADLRHPDAEAAIGALLPLYLRFGDPGLARAITLHGGAEQLALASAMQRPN